MISKIDKHKNNPNYALNSLKQGILLFWFCWFFIACTSNSMDFLIVNNIINAKFAFHSGNYFALEKVFSIYHVSEQFINLIFSLDIITQGVSAILFLIASYYFWKDYNYWPLINIAFAFSMSLWAVFIILEEIFIAYTYEGTHIRFFIFELLSLLAIHILNYKEHHYTEKS